MSRFCRVLVCALGLGLPASAQTPVGSEFQVNTLTTDYQYGASAASAAGGGFVVTWSSYGSTGNDTSSQSIQGQRFGGDGAPTGGQFQINSYTAEKQQEPSVGSAADGAFVVVWESNGSPGADASGYSIQGQRFAANGSPQGAQFQVNSYATGSQHRPAIARSGGGDFVVVWASNGSPGTDTSGYSIQGQRFDAAGAAAGTQFQINSYATSFQIDPSVATSANGDFVVVWRSDGSFGSDTDSYSIQGQRYASNGSPQGAQFQVNSDTTAPQRFTAVAADPSGDFVVSWVSDVSSGTDTSYRSVQGRFFAADGTPQGAQFQVNSYTTETQTFPAVARGGGNFVVVWRSGGSSGTDSSGLSVQAQRYLPEPDATLGLAAGLLLLIGLRARPRQAALRAARDATQRR